MKKAKLKDFASNLKLKKALGDYKASLNFGDKLNMFNCLYKVIKSEKAYTILEDEKNNRFALPTDKLTLLMKKGQVNNYGFLNLRKANPKNAHPHSAPLKSEYHGKPVGSITQGQDGSQYKKISDNPSRWAKVNEGTVHSHPGGEEEHVLSQPEFQQAHSKVLLAIKTNTNPEDHSKLEGLLTDWLKTKKKASSYKHETNVTDVDEKGRRLPKAAPAGRIAEHAKLDKLATEKYAELKEALKQASTKKSTGSAPVSTGLAKKLEKQEPGKGSLVKLKHTEAKELLDKGTYSIISAGKNPKSEKDMSDKDVAARHEKLKTELKKMGYQHMEAEGNYEGSKETSLIIPNMTDNDAKALGKKFNQDSVISSDSGNHKLIYTTGQNEDQHHKGKGWEEKPKATESYTKIRTSDGKDFKFSLNLDFDKLH